jgi:hypothetical protein
MSTDNTPFGGLDKLLLSPTQPEKKAQEKTRPKQTSKKTRKQAEKEPPAPKAITSPSTTIPFDPEPPQKQRLTRKQTFEFSKDELDFLDTAKFELRESGVTKNEIIRTGLELLAKDHQANKEASFLVRKITSLQGSWE